VLVPAHQEQNRSGYLDTYEDVSPEIWDSLGVKGIERMLDTQGGPPGLVGNGFGLSYQLLDSGRAHHC
jgi:hypothetical protein|tara:strand:+ start:94 stop:297 length:204 start_codon:yes stop_codon:yes gene_type:complete